MKLHSTVLVRRPKTGHMVAVVTAHKRPRMFVHPTRFPAKDHAVRFADKVQAAGAFNPEHWVELSVAHYLTNGSVRTLAATEKTAA